VSRVLQWLRRSRVAAGGMEQRSARKLYFHMEQDGVPERALKERWKQILAGTPTASRAYLVLASCTEGAQPSVVLCVCPKAAEEQALARRLGEPFHDAFRREEHLDIAFLDVAQESELAKVCRPFYVATV